jgi:hypothetical protein
VNSASRWHLRFRPRLRTTVIGRRPSPCARSQTRPSWRRTRSLWSCVWLRRTRGRSTSRRNVPQWRPKQIRPSHRRPRPRCPPRLRLRRHLRPRLTQPPPPSIIVGRIHPRPSNGGLRLVKGMRSRLVAFEGIRANGHTPNTPRVLTPPGRFIFISLANALFSTQIDLSLGVAS